MSLFRRDRLEIKLGGYAIGSPVALTDPKLLTVTQDYKRHTAARMAPLEADDIRKRLPESDYHASLKVDGEFNVLAFADGEAITVNPGGTVRVGLPFQKEAADRLKAAGVKKAIFAGELYFVRSDGKRPRVHDVSRVARQPASRAELEDLRFAPFDIIEVDGEGPSKTYRQTWQRMKDLLGGGTRVDLPESHWLKDGAEVEKQFRKYVDAGAEGLIVRSDAAGQYKIKPRSQSHKLPSGIKLKAGRSSPIAMETFTTTDRARVLMVIAQLSPRPARIDVTLPC